VIAVSGHDKRASGEYREMWKDRLVLVTGGASFIGSHLVDSLLENGAIVTVVDDFSSGKLENLEYPLRKRGRGRWTSRNLTVHRADLKERSHTRKAIRDFDVVFHLAAQHGGRGYIHTHPAECCTNMALDQIVFEEAWRAGVERVCFASSACVYPHYLQEQAGSSYLLKEEDADPFVRDRAFADLEYGWGKLMSEMALRAYHREHGLKASSVRIFTAYGERENETHAIIALIAKTLVRMDPFEIWGTGDQDRNFTYVGDIVNAMMLAAEKIEDASPVNAGRADRITLNQAAGVVFKLLDWRPREIAHDVSKPVGVASRAADLTRARALLSWEPQVSYEEGFRRTIEWYRSHKDFDAVRRDLPKLLMER
jgi:nucleoside-diphosphate-sugar epimerase